MCVSPSTKVSQETFVSLWLVGIQDYDTPISIDLGLSKSDGISLRMTLACMEALWEAYNIAP